MEDQAQLHIPPRLPLLTGGPFDGRQMAMTAPVADIRTKRPFGNRWDSPEGDLIGIIWWNVCPAELVVRAKDPTEWYAVYRCNVEYRWTFRHCNPTAQALKRIQIA